MCIPDAAKEVDEGCVDFCVDFLDFIYIAAEKPGRYFHLLQRLPADLRFNRHIGSRTTGSEPKVCLRPTGSTIAFMVAPYKLLVEGRSTAGGRRINENRLNRKNGLRKIVP
jgi:hypothetical protein